MSAQGPTAHLPAMWYLFLVMVGQLLAPYDRSEDFAEQVKNSLKVSYSLWKHSYKRYAIEKRGQEIVPVSLFS